jgi:predicted nucleic acid-binding protein
VKHSLIDTNVLIRFLVETHESVPAKFKGVFSFFEKVERAELCVQLPDLVLFEAFFVLTRLYDVPATEAADALDHMVAFRGVFMQDKVLMHSCLSILKTTKIDLVDVYILAVSRRKSISTVYSFDQDLEKNGLELLRID